MRSFIILSAFVLLASCAPAEPPAPTPESTAPTFGFGSRATMTGEAAEQLAQQCSRTSPGPIEDTWLPDGAEIDAFDAALAPLLQAELTGTSRADATPAHYYRQFAGYFIGGRRIIYVNGVHGEAIQSNADPDFDWRRQPVNICDGGAISFGAEYDPETNQITNFAFNGALGGAP